MSLISTSASLTACAVLVFLMLVLRRLKRLELQTARVQKDQKDAQHRVLRSVLALKRVMAKGATSAARAGAGRIGHLRQDSTPLPRQCSVRWLRRAEGSMIMHELEDEQSTKDDTLSLEELEKELRL